MLTYDTLIQLLSSSIMASRIAEPLTPADSKCSPFSTAQTWGSTVVPSCMVHAQEMIVDSILIVKFGISNYCWKQEV